MFNFKNSGDNGLVETDDFFSNFSEPVEEFAPPTEIEAEVKETAPPNQTTEPDGFETVEDSDAFLELNQDIGGFMVETGDIIFAWLIGMFVAKNNETDHYKLPTREIDKIKLLVGKIVPTNKPIMPNWLALLISVGGAYTPIVASAMQDRKIAEQQAEIVRLKAEIEKAEIEKAKNEKETKPNTNTDEKN